MLPSFLFRVNSTFLKDLSNPFNSLGVVIGFFLLGDILLDRLLDVSEYKDFGVELNSQNINKHIQNLREDRIKFINIDYYRKEVFL